jgi:hypothetical protein
MRTRKSATRRAWVIGALLLTSLMFAGFALANRHRASAAPSRGVARRDYLRQLAEDEPTAANFKLLAQASAEMDDFPGANRAYAHAADLYRGKNMISEGYAADRLAEHYEVEAVPFVQRPTDPGDVRQYDTRARLEPVYGCYTGAFIDHEDSIHGTYRDEYGTWRRDASAFNHLTGIHHAIFFMYLGYGRTFPAKFVTHMNDNGAAAQIAWEPDSLDQVQDDDYLHEFAREAKASHTPIFLRFASEMNGDWVPYNGNPAAYIAKFRLVAKVMHAEAPNVAMVWCPFETPVRTIADYYPGPDAVDWVGINIYSVPFWDNDPRRTAEWRNPADSLRFIYGKYAARHPIMICEYGASHRSSLDGVERADFARDKLGELYAALPRVYPRVKAVCWLSMNAIRHAIPGRQKNDYSLLGNDWVRQRYKEVVDDPYFLGAVSRGAPAAARKETAALRDGDTIHGKVPLSAWVKLYDDDPRVIWRVNGEERYSSTTPGPYRWVLDTAKLPPGPATIELIVQDQEGREAAHETRTVQVQ